MPHGPNDPDSSPSRGGADPFATTRPAAQAPDVAGQETSSWGDEGGSGSTRGGAPPPPTAPTAGSGTAPTGLGSDWAHGVFEPGRVLFGKYVVVRKLGQGGMGAVWLVRHDKLDAERALKLITARVEF